MGYLAMVFLILMAFAVISNAGYYFQTGLNKKHLTQQMSYGAIHTCGDST